MSVLATWQARRYLYRVSFIARGTLAGAAISSHGPHQENLSTVHQLPSLRENPCVSILWCVACLIFRNVAWAVDLLFSILNCWGIFYLSIVHRVPVISPLSEKVWHLIHYPGPSRREYTVYKLCEMLIWQCVLQTLLTHREHAPQIHWLSIINSLVLVFLLIGFVIIIMVGPGQILYNPVIVIVVPI